MLLPVATEFDEESNILYAETDELGTYCVLDMEILMRDFGIEPNGLAVENVEQQMYSAATFGDQKNKSDKYIVTFIIDIRKGAFSSEQLSTIWSEISKFAMNSYPEQRDTTIRIVAQGSTDFRTVSQITVGDYTTPGGAADGLLYIGAMTSISEDEIFGEVYVLTDALSDAVENFDASANNYVFDIFNPQNVVFEQGIADELCKNAKKNGVNISVISPTGASKGFQKTLVSNTNGIEITKTLECVKDIYEHVYNEKYVPKESMSVILATGGRKIVLDSKLYPNGQNPYGKDSDTDNDGITDWDEVRNDLLKRDSEGNYTLPTVQECMDALGDVPFYVENAFRIDGYPVDDVKAIVFSQLKDYKVLPIKSDPTSIDSDEDGLSDTEENDFGSNPLTCDSDCDGLDDGEEFYLGTNPLEKDSDGDGLSDYLEVELWFDPLNPNPDGDKFNDYVEYKNGTNPLYMI